MTANLDVMRSSANFRHGIVLPPQSVKRTLADVDGVVNIAIPENSAEPWASAAGGIARNAHDAELAAIGEALERYAAGTCPLPIRRQDEIDGVTLALADFSFYSEEQQRDTEFPHGELYEADVDFTNVFSLTDNSEAWVPVDLVALRRGAALTTSSGLAAGSSRREALLRAVQELVERDALMVTWLHGVPGRRVPLPEHHVEPVVAIGGEAICIDATPDYSPHAVALVCGQLPLRGRPRYSLGAACRETWEAAVEKAYLEWIQGVVFAGYYLSHNRDVVFSDPREVRTFDDHAVYYTVRPDQWDEIALLKGATVEARDGDAASFAALMHGLDDAGFRVYYRDLTTSDLRLLGVSVVRALSPDLAPIGCDQRWPFLGGTVADVASRYAWAADVDLRFPNPRPHPLG